MKLGITAQGVTGPLVKVDAAGLRQVRGWGFNCIGTRVAVDDPLPTDEVRRISSLLDGEGVEVGQAWVPGSFISADDRAVQSLPQMRASVESLGKLGIRVAVVADGSLSPARRLPPPSEEPGPGGLRPRRLPVQRRRQDRRG